MKPFSTIWTDMEIIPRAVRRSSTLQAWGPVHTFKHCREVQTQINFTRLAGNRGKGELNTPVEAFLKDIMAKFMMLKQAQNL